MMRRRITFTRTATALAAAAAVLVGSGLAAAPASADADPGAAAGHSPTQHYAETTLWDTTVGPRVSYHVQGLTVLPDDTVLAFAEGRYETCDAGPRDIELRRSTDGGQTFEPSQVVADSGGVASYGNPTALADAETGRVFLFYNESFRLPENTTCSGDSAKMFYRTSDDEGVTWSDATEITSLFTDNDYGWTLHGPGPGHGIQLQDGRLVVQVAHRRPIVGTTAPTRNYGVTDIYSDDHGQTWQQSTPITVSPDYPINESRIVERSDGSIVVNGRYAAGGSNYRISAVSTDGGESWSDPVFDAETGKYVAIDSGFTSWTVPAGGGTSRLLFSRPDATNRSNLTVSISYDEGYTYPYSRVANAGPSYYSDLATLSDGTAVMLYGRDGTSASVPERIVLARFDMAWVTDGADSGKKAPVTERWTELGTTSASTSAGATAGVVSDPNARGGQYLGAMAAAAGDYVDIPFSAHNTGDVSLALRYHRDLGTAAVQVSVDGTPLGAPFDPTLTKGAAFETYDLGALRLHSGGHTLRITATGPGASGGLGITPDDLVLTTSH